MSDTLVRIKRAILAGHYAFSEKASIELEADGLTELDVAESIVNAVAIYKTIRSTSPVASNRQGISAHHSKHQLGRHDDLQQGQAGARGWGGAYYFLISSKRAA